MNAVATQGTGWTPLTRRALMLTVASWLALLALFATTVSVAPISAHAAPTHITKATQTTRMTPVNLPHMTPPRALQGHAPALYCGMPNAPKATLIRSATRAEAKADMVKRLGKAQAAAIGDNFILASPTDVVQGTVCFGGYSSDAWAEV